MKDTAILLINLGTPDSYKPKDVYKYLIEFLTDPRVIDIPWFFRQLLVRGYIVPSRYKQSSKSYEAIWTEEGSPLLVYGKNVKTALQKKMGDNFSVELAMRYQNPSIKEALENIFSTQVKHLIIFPLFPHYASATTGSVHQKVMENIKHFPVIPKLTFIDHFATHPSYISAICRIAQRYDLNEYDHFLFSFHGLPKRQIIKSKASKNCYKDKECCQSYCRENSGCYSAQCHATARLIAQELSIAKERYSICFQSRLGKEPWLEPYAGPLISGLPKQGYKKVLVFCPSFVCDCLETIYEIGVEYQSEFKHAGGEKLDFVTGLNDDAGWIDALEEIVKAHV